MAHLFTDGVQLYGLHPYSGQIFLISKDLSTPLCKIPPSQFFYIDQEERISKEIIGLQFADGNLYLILSSFTQKAGLAYELYCWNLTDAKMNEISNIHAKAIYFGTEQELLLRIGGQDGDSADEIWLYDIPTQALIKRLATEGNEKYNACIWQPESQILYYIDEKATIKSLNADGKSLKKAYLPLTFVNEGDAAFLSNEGMYVFPSRGNLFVRDISLPGEREQQTVKIMGQIDPTIAVAFTAENPDVSVVSDLGATDFLSIQSSMISGDADIDLYIVNSSRSFAQVRDKGYAAPMNENEQLVSAGNAFYPAIAEELFRDGQLIAFPENYMADTWTLNKTVWDELDLGEFPSTIEELYQALEMWEADYAVDHQNYTLLESHEGTFGFVALLIKQYLLEHETSLNPVSFNDEGLKQALRATMDHRNTLDQIPEDKMPIIMTYPQYFGIGYNDSDQVISVAPPAISNDASRPIMATMELFILNPGSSRSDVALEFVEYYYSHKDAMFRYSLTPTLNEPVRPDNFETWKEETLSQISIFEDMLKTSSEENSSDIESMLEREQQYLQNIEKHSWDISTDSIEVYRELAQYIKVPTRTMFANDRGGQGDESTEQFIKLFIDARITLEQFIEKLDNLAKMIYLEQE